MTALFFTSGATFVTKEAPKCFLADLSIDVENIFSANIVIPWGATRGMHKIGEKRRREKHIIHYNLFVVQSYY